MRAYLVACGTVKSRYYRAAAEINFHTRTTSVQRAQLTATPGGPTSLHTEAWPDQVGKIKTKEACEVAGGSCAGVTAGQVDMEQGGLPCGALPSKTRKHEAPATPRTVLKCRAAVVATVCRGRDQACTAKCFQNIRAEGANFRGELCKVLR